eukprot:18509-Eustigmatos_ZCMA.PRE.1
MWQAAIERAAKRVAAAMKRRSTRMDLVAKLLMPALIEMQEETEDGYDDEAGDEEYDDDGDGEEEEEEGGDEGEEEVHQSEELGEGSVGRNRAVHDAGAK